MSIQTLLDKYNASIAPNVVLARQQASDGVSVRTLIPPSVLVTQYTSDFSNRPLGDLQSPTTTKYTSLALAIYDKEIASYVDSSVFVINENASASTTWYLNQRSTAPGALYSTTAAPFSS